MEMKFHLCFKSERAVVWKCIKETISMSDERRLSQIMMYIGEEFFDRIARLEEAH